MGRGGVVDPLAADLSDAAHLSEVTDFIPVQRCSLLVLCETLAFHAPPPLAPTPPPRIYIHTHARPPPRAHAHTTTDNHDHTHVSVNSGDDQTKRPGGIVRLSTHAKAFRSETNWHYQCLWHQLSSYGHWKTETADFPVAELLHVPGFS